MRIYGPYTRKTDGRQHVITIDDNGKRRTISYPKYLMEQLLGRELDPELETIDHIDGNFYNNDPNNLRILPRIQHATEDALRANLIEITCILCGNKAFKSGSKMKHNGKQGKAGPFCSKECAGKYGAELQNGRQEKLGRAPIPKTTYYKTKKI